jgi:hypothetical protein
VTITRGQMFSGLLGADPSFGPAWKTFVEEWEGEPDPPLYLALADLARHLIAHLQRGETDRFDAVFDEVERWHLSGDDYVRKAATVGLLESLQNSNLHARTRPSDFEPWLRPESRRWWVKLQSFWAGGPPLADT